MFEAKLTIEAPGLTNAINRLADAIAYSHAPAAIPSANPTPGQTARGPPALGRSCPGCAHDWPRCRPF